MGIQNEWHFYEKQGNLRIRMTNDYLFKALMQKNPLVLKHLICSILHLNPLQIKEAEIQNPIVLGEQVNDKDIILDVLVQLNNGALVDLEMQVADEKNWVDRSTYYVCANFTNLNSGEDYTRVRPSIHIGLLDFTLFKDHPKFYRSFFLTDPKDGLIYTQKLSIRIIDLTGINLASAEDKRYNIDKWARFFKAQSWEDLKDMAATDSIIASAVKTVSEIDHDKAIYYQCRAREDYRRRMNGIRNHIAKIEKEKATMSKTISEQTEEINIQAEKIDKQAEEIKQLKAQLESLKSGQAL